MTELYNKESVQHREEVQKILDDNMVAEFLLQQPSLPLQKASFMQMILLDEIVSLLETQWDCTDVLRLCQKLNPEWYQTEPQQGWLEYSYWSIISWSYPESVELEQHEAYRQGVLFFVRVLRCVLDAEHYTNHLTPLAILRS